MRSARSRPLLLATAFLMLVGRADAARLMRAVFEQDGKIVLQTYYDDSGYPKGPTVWRYLAKEPIMVSKEHASTTVALSLAAAPGVGVA